jgi:hypothetical protein
MYDLCWLLTWQWQVPEQNAELEVQGTQEYAEGWLTDLTPQTADCIFILPFEADA